MEKKKVYIYYKSLIGQRILSQFIDRNKFEVYCGVQTTNNKHIPSVVRSGRNMSPGDIHIGVINKYSYDPVDARASYRDDLYINKLYDINLCYFVHCLEAMFPSDFYDKDFEFVKSDDEIASYVKNHVDEFKNCDVIKRIDEILNWYLKN